MNKNIRFFKAQKLHYGGFDAQWLSSEKMRRSRHRERADSRSTVIGCQKMKPEFYYCPIIMQQKEAALPIWNVIEFLLLCFGGANEFLFSSICTESNCSSDLPVSGQIE